MRGRGIDERYRIEEGGVLDAFALPPDARVEATRRIGREGGLAYRIAAPEPGEIDTLFDVLVERGRRALARPAAERVDAIGRACERFLDPGDPVRTEALRLLPGYAALSDAGATDVLDAMASDWTRERLSALVASEFGDTPPEHRFSRPGPDPAGRAVRRLATPGALTLTVCSGTVPGVSVTAAIRSLLVGSGTLLKPGAGDVVLPLLFARALAEVDRELASALAVVYWPGGEGELEARALEAADRIVVYGDGETLRSVRTRANPAATLVEYRHRVGLAVVGVSGRSEPELVGLAESVTDAVVPYEQRGCVSPVRIYALGSEDEVRAFGRCLSRALERRERWVPGSRTPEEAAAAHQLVGALELRRAAGEAVEVWSGAEWTVAVEGSGELFAGGRVVLVSGVAKVDDLRREIGRFRGRLQVVGVGGLEAIDEAVVAHTAAEAGASRIGPLRGVAYPPPWWRHEGMGPLAALVDEVEWVVEE
jgi:hypothetical protein